MMISVLLCLHSSNSLELRTGMMAPLLPGLLCAPGPVSARTLLEYERAELKLSSLSDTRRPRSPLRLLCPSHQTRRLPQGWCARKGPSGG